MTRSHTADLGRDERASSAATGVAAEARAAAPAFHALLPTLDALVRDAGVGVALLEGRDAHTCYANPAFHALHALLHAVAHAAEHAVPADDPAAPAGASEAAPVLETTVGTSWPPAAAAAVGYLLAEVRRSGQAGRTDMPVWDGESFATECWTVSAWPVNPLSADARAPTSAPPLLLVVDASRAARLAGRLRRDVTERVLLHALAESARADAADAARTGAEAVTRAQSEAIAGMSHELRTPLNAILSHVDLLLLELHGPVTAAQRAALGRVSRAQQHLLALVNNVLALARAGTGHMEFEIDAVPLEEELAEVAALMAPLFAQRGLAFSADVFGTALGAGDVGTGGGTGAPVRIWADRVRLRQVLLNLLSNALKFTPAGGRVSLAVEALVDAPEHVALRVRDTGVGIPAEAVGRVCEPFVRVRTPGAQPVEGTGLGLAIARELARGMGGELTLRSTLGVGTEATVIVRRTVTADGAPVERRGRGAVPTGVDPDRSAGAAGSGADG